MNPLNNVEYPLPFQSSLPPILPKLQPQIPVTKMFKMAPSRIFVATMIVVVSASYPEFTPGKGLPSLEELGLTSEQLFTTPPPALATRVDDKYTQHTRCRSSSEGSEYAANVDDVIACYNYLVALGDYTCRERELCRIGSAKISGLNKNGHRANLGWDVPYVFSTAKCWDAALGLQWIFTNCNEGGKVMGYKEVGGGEYLIAATRSNIVFAAVVDPRPVDLWKIS
ncbi:hypothetical protein VE01_05658 [Pseudogymnoascus verrucosus]|uniref:Uncharacterized protein n=1 Tax=Pseudogymnoascus verrucosus TaxID=342668 RepID=A0A1B8GKX3_9PEZI|nr:uncharacterized protein VE01_05658 [Pseudogymnoascus verrucosus]OBT96485.2 hypothetical protein VE01_05658 [Pseudogymnoascus verrucosus]